MPMGNAKGDISHKKVGEILIEKGFLKPEQLEEALKAQHESPGMPLGQTLIRRGWITEDQLAECLAQQRSIPYITIRAHQVSAAVLALISKDISKRYGILPVDRIGNILTVAIYDELSQEEIALLEKTVGCRLKFFFVTLSDFKAAYTALYPGEAYVG